VLPASPTRARRTYARVHMRTRVHLLGRLEVQWDGEQLEAALPGRQGRLLFAYLTLHRARPVRRDELIEALWSNEGPPPSGDGLLRPPLSRLRKADQGGNERAGGTEMRRNPSADASLPKRGRRFPPD